MTKDRRKDKQGAVSKQRRNRKQLASFKISLAIKVYSFSISRLEAR